MAEDQIDKVLATFAGISAGDVDLATKYIDHKRFVQHNPYAADGVKGLKQVIRQSPREQLQLSPVRAFQDGPYVLTQAKGQRAGRNIFFDIFRFEEGLVVEHWAFSTMDAPPNPSGHTQIDGPTEARHPEDTEKNKEIVRDYYQTFHISGDQSRIDQYFAGDLMVRHEPGVHDGIPAFLRDVEVLMQHRTIDEVKILLGQGDFVSSLPKEHTKVIRASTSTYTGWKVRSLWSIGAFRSWSRPPGPRRTRMECCRP